MTKYYCRLFDAIREIFSEPMPPSKRDNNTEAVNYLISLHAIEILGVVLEWHQYNYATPIAELNQKLI